MRGGPCSPQESAGVVCSRLSRRGTAEPPPLLPSLQGFWDPWEQGKVKPQAPAGTGGPVAPGRLGSIPAVPVPRARRPPWHSAPSCSHHSFQMFLIILTATSRARRASQTGDLLFLWDCSPPAGEGKGREGPALLTATAAPARALTCLTDGIWLQLSCLRRNPGLAARAPGKRGFCCLIPAAPGAAEPWGDTVGGRGVPS